MAPNISRDTYDKSKKYTKLILQQGVPVLDADFNEAQDILSNITRDIARYVLGDVAVGDTLKIVGTEAVNDFTIKAGSQILVAGLSVFLSTDCTYMSQPDWASPTALTTPAGADRTDVVYVHCWFDTIDSTQDTNIKDPTLNIETCQRKKLRAAIKVAEGGTCPTNDSTNWYTPLATIARTDGKSVIGATDVTDERTLVGDTYSEVVDARSSAEGGDFATLDERLEGHETRLSTAAVSVHGIQQGDGNGFVADAVDGFHASQSPIGGQVPVLSNDGKYPAASGANITAVNADTVDGFHAAATPAANKLCVFDGSGKYPAADGSNITGISFAVPGRVPIGFCMPCVRIGDDHSYIYSDYIDADGGVWMHMDGRSLSKTVYPELFGVCRYLFGGSGDSFNLPSTGKKFIAGSGGTVSNHYITGSSGGAESVTLTGAQSGCRDHYHQVYTQGLGGGGLSVSVPMNGGATAYAKTAGVVNGALDALSAHENRPPFIALPWFIRVK